MSWMATVEYLLMLVQDLLCVFQRGADRNGDEIFFRHHFVDRNVEAGFETEIAVGEDTD